jgi:hypothetical protein
MKRRLFFLLWIIFVFQAPAYPAIQIYANGHSYGSLQAYLTSKGSAKTAQVNHEDLSDAARHKLYVLSVEHGVVSALQDFYQTRGQSYFQISPEQLQEAIQQAVATSKEPKLLVSEGGKVRIMALIAGDNK